MAGGVVVKNAAGVTREAATTVAIDVVASRADAAVLASPGVAADAAARIKKASVDGHSVVVAISHRTDAVAARPHSSESSSTGRAVWPRVHVLRTLSAVGPSPAIAAGALAPTGFVAAESCCASVAVLRVRA